jgi:hypothetical protein
MEKGETIKNQKSTIEELKKAESEKDQLIANCNNNWIKIAVLFYI